MVRAIEISALVNAAMSMRILIVGKDLDDALESIQHYLAHGEVYREDRPMAVLTLSHTPGWIDARFSTVTKHAQTPEASRHFRRHIVLSTPQLRIPFCCGKLVVKVPLSHLSIGAKGSVGE
jgi:hypothetical protein